MKNDYEIRGDVTAIFLVSPKYGIKETLISTSKLEKAKSFANTWYLAYVAKRDMFYVYGNHTLVYRKRSIVPLHRWLNDYPKKMIDHIDHDTLNNTDENLREVTNAENMQNRKGATKTSRSGVRGVTWSKKYSKWQVRIKVNSKSKHFGSFDTIEEAEKVAIAKRKELMPFTTEISA